MLKNYCLRDKDVKDHKTKFSTDATVAEVGRVVSMVSDVNKSGRLNTTPQEAVMETLRVLGFEVLTGVHYDEVYTL